MTKFKKFLSVDTKKTRATRRLTLVFITPVILLLVVSFSTIKIIYEESHHSVTSFFQRMVESIKELYKEYW